MEPLISVVVPVYKVEDYLNRCVESIVNQTYKNLEIILVDDGSPDNCPEMCDRWAEKDNRIKVIHKENGGLSDARNAGLEIAAGDYISFIDSDDWIDLQTYLLVIDKMLETDSDIGSFDYISVKDDSFIADNTDDFLILNSEEGILCTINNNLIKTVAWNKVYHKRILTDLRFEFGKTNEDEFFTFRALDKAERIVFLKRQCYYYFQRSSSIMGSYSIKRLDMLDGVYERMVFTKANYPHIYVNAKTCFSLCCVYHYQMLLKNKNMDSYKEAKHKIKTLRKKAKVTFREINNYPIIDKISLIFSNTSFGMGLVSVFRNLLGYGV